MSRNDPASARQQARPSHDPTDPRDNPQRSPGEATKGARPRAADTRSGASVYPAADHPDVAVELARTELDLGRRTEAASALEALFGNPEPAEIEALGELVRERGGEPDHGAPYRRRQGASDRELRCRQGRAEGDRGARGRDRRLARTRTGPRAQRDDDGPRTEPPLAALLRSDRARRPRGPVVDLRSLHAGRPDPRAGQIRSRTRPTEPRRAEIRTARPHEALPGPSAGP